MLFYFIFHARPGRIPSADYFAWLSQSFRSPPLAQWRPFSCDFNFHTLSDDWDICTLPVRSPIRSMFEMVSTCQKKKKASKVRLGARSFPLKTSSDRTALFHCASDSTGEANHSFSETLRIDRATQWMSTFTSGTTNHMLSPELQRGTNGCLKSQPSIKSWGGPLG